MDMRGLGCSFTGHRELDPSHRGRLQKALLDIIERVYNDGVRRFYNGGAYGFDLEAARAVLLFKMSHPDVSLHIFVPCPGQSARWSIENKRIYDYVLSQADTVDTLSPHYFNGCMQFRNSRLIDAADILIAYVGKTSGGSYQTLTQAQRKGLTVYNIFLALEDNIDI